MGSPVSPEIANIYMEYFEESTLEPLLPIPTPWWKRYVDDIICIVKKDQVDILFNHINQMDVHIKFIMESPDSDGSIPFLDTKCPPYSCNIILTIVYRKPSHTDRYLEWNSNHPRSAKRSVITALTHRVKMVYSIPELLAKEMDNLHWVLCRNNYPDWFLKKPDTRPQVDKVTSQDTTKEVSISVPYTPGLNNECRRIFKDTKAQIIFKRSNTHKSLLMYAKDKIPPHLWKDVVYQWIYPEETHNSSYIGKSRRCLKNRIKEHNTSTTSGMYQHNSTHNHLKGDISHFKIIYQDSKHVSKEVRETMHIRRTNPVLNCNIDKLYIPNIFNQLLGATDNSSTGISTNPNIPNNPPTTDSIRSTGAVCLHN